MGLADGSHNPKLQDRHALRPLHAGQAGRASLDNHFQGLCDWLSARREGRDVGCPAPGDDGKQHYEALGAADDARDADGLTVYSFSQAQDRARAFFAKRARELAGDFEPSAGPYTVAKALDAYFTDRERRGSKGLAKDRAAARVRILPTLGEIKLSKLATKRIRDWHTDLAAAAKLTRTARIVKTRKSQAVDMMDADAVRARRATANRTHTVLKAALNHAYHEGRASTDEAWRKVKPFREADAPVIHFLSNDECRRIDLPLNFHPGAIRVSGSFTP